MNIKANYKLANKEKILLVEDDLVNCEVAVDMLEEIGIDVDVANDGQQAIDLYGINQYSLILMDCEMPIMDGITATKKIRINERESQHNTTPIIALTAHSISETKEKCITSGMNDFLSKPFSMSSLHSILDKWLAINEGGVTEPSVDHNENSIQDSDLNYFKCDTAFLNYNVLHKLYLKQQRNGSNVLNHIISIYLEQSSRLLSDLAEATRKLDVEKVRTITHTLKSSSVNVGASSLSELCREVEMAGAKGKIENILLRQVHDEFIDVEKALTDVLEHMNSSQSK